MPSPYAPFSALLIIGVWVQDNFLALFVTYRAQLQMKHKKMYD